jgi:hypothetical protein
MPANQKETNHPPNEENENDCWCIIKSEQKSLFPIPERRKSFTSLV